MQHPKKPLIEVWNPSDPRFGFLLPSYMAAAGRAVADRKVLWPNYIDVTNVGGIDAVICHRAHPHTDPDFNRWFVMWVLRSRGHLLSVKNIRANPDWQKHHARVRYEPDATATLEEGQMFILDGHRTHWLDREGADEWFVALTRDVRIRPTREKAERLILSAIGSVFRRDEASPRFGA